jgi:hypothetical protein
VVDRLPWTRPDGDAFGGFPIRTLVAYRDTAAFFIQEEIVARLVVIDGAHAMRVTSAL